MTDRHLNDDGTVVDLDAPSGRDAAIDACTRCNPEGYRGRLVCDHRTHNPGPGRAAVEAELAKIRSRQVERAKQPYRTDDTTEEGEPE